jgi:hypothetical protein
MARNLTFELVGPEDIDYLRECRTKRDIWETLSTIFIAHLEDELLWKHPEEKKQGLRDVFLDYMTTVTAKLLSSLNEPEKVSVALHVSFDTFATSFASHRTKKQALDHMSTLINRHAAADPPVRFMVFTIEDVKTVSGILIDTLFASYDQFYGLFATVLVSHFVWGPVNFGRFPRILPLDYGTAIPHPIENAAIRQLYFSSEGDEELDELELKELMRGSLR